MNYKRSATTRDPSLLWNGRAEVLRLRRRWHAVSACVSHHAQERHAWTRASRLRAVDLCRLYDSRRERMGAQGLGAICRENVALNINLREKDDT